jgi:hypothetical protein
MSSARWTVGSAGELIMRVREARDEEIWMRNVELSDKAAAHLANALVESRVLLELWLSNCEVSDCGAGELARALSHPHTILKFLNLSGNNIGDNGASDLFSALEMNEGLQSLFLNENRIGDEGAIALANVIRKNKSLREIYLWDNQITDVGADAIANALLLNKTLTKCEIDNGDEDESNKISDKEILITIRTYCDRNDALAKNKMAERDPATFRRTTRDLRDFEKV